MMFKEHCIEFRGNVYKCPGCGSEYTDFLINLGTEKTSFTIYNGGDDRKILSGKRIKKMEEKFRVTKC